MTDYGSFVAAVLALLITPGPTNTLLATSGATAGVKLSLPLLGSELLGYLVSILAFRSLFGFDLDGSPFVFSILRLCVSIYLVWLSVTLWKGHAPQSRTGTPITFRTVFTTTVSNPKALVFATVIIPAVATKMHLYFALFSITVVSVGFVWIVLGRAIMSGLRLDIVHRMAAIVLLIFAGTVLASLLPFSAVPKTDTGLNELRQTAESG